MKRQFIAGIVVVGLLAVPVIVKFTRSEPARRVEIEKIAYREIKSSILASGHLLYQEQVLLSPEVIGKVNTIYVIEGQKVSKGDLLLNLEGVFGSACSESELGTTRNKEIGCVFRASTADPGHGAPERDAAADLRRGAAGRTVRAAPRKP